VDVVASSDTKAMAGHGDVLFGHVASRRASIIGKVKRWRKLAGSIPGPAEAALVHRGLETVDVRLARMCETAGVIARRLRDHKQVNCVRYPGLSEDPSHAVAARQMRGFGFLIGFELDSKAAANRFLGNCKGIVNATSFGSVHTSAERRARWGDDVAPGYIRLSIGVEPCNALWAEIETALER
jgi:cystathionine gamma-lyase